MGIANDIKELEEKAKTAEYYKEKYENILQQLTSELLPYIKNFLERFSVKGFSPRHYTASNKTASVIKIISDELYIELKADDSKRIFSGDIEKKLEEKGICKAWKNITAIRNNLLARDNIKEWKEGYKKYLFFEQKESVKIGKVNYMG